MVVVAFLPALCCVFCSNRFLNARGLPHSFILRFVGCLQVAQTSNPFHMPEYRQSLFGQQEAKQPARVNVHQQPGFKQDAADSDDHFHVGLYLLFQ